MGGKRVSAHLGCKAILVSTISGKAVGHQVLALRQYADTLLRCIRYKITRPDYLHRTKPKTNHIIWKLFGKYSRIFEKGTKKKKKKGVTSLTHDVFIN